MTKINELINTHKSYAQYVNLAQTFDDPTENRDRMKDYMPIKSHRDAFIRLMRALYPLDNRVYLLTGSYGTGKSHLCLMLSNYLTLKPSDVEMDQFFKNWAKSDPDGAEKLRNLRGEGRYLLALCEYGGSDDFESLILRALQAAIQREEIHELWLDTHYQEAVRQLERWEARQRSGQAAAVWSDFLSELAQRYPNYTLDSLKEDLSAFDQEALKAFCELYRHVIGHEFSYSKDNLTAILQDFLSNPGFKTRYKGLVIVADEFGYILDHGKMHIDVFQRFAEMCQFGVAGSQVVFIGTGHKPFRAYSATGLSSSDFNVAAARVTEVPLESAELELIIAAIVSPNKSHPAWLLQVASQAGMFNRFALNAGRIGLFKHLKGPEVRTRIIEDIYPMHPMAVHCLTEMSTEIGSNARSVFRFFSGAVDSVAVDGSYRWFNEQHEVSSQGKLNLYTADLLTQYFANELKPDYMEARVGVRQHVSNYRASLNEVRKQAQAELLQQMDALVERILNILLVYEISKIAPTFENLAFGLYCEAPAEKSQLQNRLDALVKSKVLLQASSGLFAFRQGGQGIDFDASILEYKADLDHLPKNLAEEVVNLVPLGRGGQWLEAKNYNMAYDEDKRLLRLFVEPGELEAKFTLKSTGEQVNFFQFQQAQLAGIQEWKDRYEAVQVFVLCETDQDTQRARQAAEKNVSARLIVGIPRQPIPIREAVMNLRAALHIRDTVDLDAMSLQDRQRLQDDYIGDERHESGFTGKLIQLRRRYLEGKELSWYAQDGAMFIAQPKSEYEPADELMGRLYTQRNTFSHPYLNTIHVTKFGPGKDAPLSDAIAILLRSQRAIEIDPMNTAANRGEMRWLKNVLADNGALRQAQAAKGSLVPYEIEPAREKYRVKLPALAGLLDRLSALEQGKTLSVRQLLQEIAQPAYGQGPLAAALLFAYAVRVFGDELRLQLQPGAVGYVTMNDPDLVINLVNGQHPNAVLERQAINPAAHGLINDVFNLFAAEPGAAGQNQSINAAFAAMNAWWSALPNLAKAPDSYLPQSSTLALVNLLRTMDQLNPHQLILEQLQTVYAFPDDAVITPASQATISTGLKNDKAAIEDSPRCIQEKLLKRLLQPFHPQSDFYTDYQAAIENWYKNLGEEQQDDFASWHSNASRSLVKHLRAIVNLETTFFDQLPRDAGFGLGKVEDWHRDRSEEYAQMLVTALERIEANRVKVPAPKWEAKGIGLTKKETQRHTFQISFRNGASLRVQVPEVGIKVLLTDSNEDPRTALQRQVVTDSFEMTVSKGCIVQLVSQDSLGNYGVVLSLSFVNEDRKYEVTPLSQQSIFEREYKFVYPKDRQALEVLFSSILKEVMQKELISEAEARQMLIDLAEKLKGQY